MTVTCPYCGSQAAGNFCSICGNKLHMAPEPVQAMEVRDAPADPMTAAVGTIFQKLFGISEFLNVLSTVHVPLRGVRKLVASEHVALTQAIIAYIEFVTLVPFLIKQVIQPLGEAVDYPIIVQGQAVDDSLIFYAISAVSSLAALAIVYVLPNSLFAPRTKALVIAANLYTAMYAAAYITAGDLVKVVLWSLTGSLTLPVLSGWVVMIAITALQIYVWRKILTLRWKSIAAFLGIALGVGIVQSAILHVLGLVSLG